MPDEEKVSKMREAARLRIELGKQHAILDQIHAEEKTLRQERKLVRCASHALMEDSEYRRIRRGMQRDHEILREELHLERAKRRCDCQRIMNKSRLYAPC